MDEIGDKTYVLMLTFGTTIEQERCTDITKKLLTRIKMTPAHYPTVYDYPYEGKGGAGYTYIQPITESFIIWDVWFGQGMYLQICSCKHFEIDIICKFFMEEYLPFVDIAINRMSLK